jgi:ubiquitin C-terminal hydrolase
VDSLDLRKFAGTSSKFLLLESLINNVNIEDESVKKAVYNLYGVISLVSFLNANKFLVSVYNCKEDKWYLYDDQEKVSCVGVESPSKNAYILFY